MDLTELGEFLDAPRLTLEIRGKKFTVETADGERWLKIQQIVSRLNRGLSPQVDDMEITDLYRLAVGDTFDKFLAAKLTGPELQRACMSAMFWQAGLESVAQAMWEQRLGKAKPTPTRRKTSTSTGAATTARRRASGSTTTTRRKSSNA